MYWQPIFNFILSVAQCISNDVKSKSKVAQSCQTRIATLTGSDFFVIGV